MRDIGKFGDGPAVEEVLETTEATKEFLTACKQPRHLVERPAESVVARYWHLVKAWKFRKEHTASAKNQHIGYYTAIMGHSSLS